MDVFRRLLTRRLPTRWFKKSHIVRQEGVPNPPIARSEELGTLEHENKERKESRHGEDNISPLNVGVTEPAMKPAYHLSNYRLPFDILSRIFENIEDIGSLWNPLERLERILLVCRFWRDVALEHTPLWTTFHAYAFEYEDVKLWKSCFRSRVDRCGTKTLLDISITLTNRSAYYDRSQFGACYPYVYVRNIDRPAHACMGLLRIFAGKRGAMATRWRSLELDFSRLANLTPQDESALDYFLQHRTPNLVSLRLENVITNYAPHKVAFPHAPKLQNATFDSCYISAYPDMSGLTSLTWYACETGLQVQEVPILQEISDTQNFYIIQALTAAQNLTSLEIGLDWADWETPLLSPRVEALKIPCLVNDSLLKALQLPSLRRIGLDATGYSASVTDAKGIPCEQIVILDLLYPEWYREKPSSHGAVMDNFDNLISRLTNLHTLSWDRDWYKDMELLKGIVERFSGDSMAGGMIKLPGQISKKR